MRCLKPKSAQVAVVWKTRYAQLKSAFNQKNAPTCSFNPHINLYSYYECKNNKIIIDHQINKKFNQNPSLKKTNILKNGNTYLSESSTFRTIHLEFILPIFEQHALSLSMKPFNYVSTFFFSSPSNCV